jgi:hypothetical protein
MSSELEKSILLDISFDNFLNSIDDETIKEKLISCILLAEQFSDTDYSVFIDEVNETYLTKEQATNYLALCAQFNERINSHKTVSNILETIGFNEFLKDISNVNTRTKVLYFIQICGELNLDVFEGSTDEVTLLSYGLSGDKIKKFQELCNNFRKEYKSHNLFTSMSTRRPYSLEFTRRHKE